MPKTLQEKIDTALEQIEFFSKNPNSTDMMRLQLIACGKIINELSEQLEKAIKLGQEYMDLFNLIPLSERIYAEQKHEQIQQSKEGK